MFFFPQKRQFCEFISPVSRKLRGNFAESPRVSCDSNKNSELADSCAVERNWSLLTTLGLRLGTFSVPGIWI